MSFPVFISSNVYPGVNPASFSASLNPQIILPQGEWEVALVDGQIVNSVNNLTATLGNNTMRYSNDNGVTWYDVTFPNGAYTTTGIQDQLQIVMYENGHYTTVNGVITYPIVFGVNLTLLRVNVQLNADFTIDLSTGSLYQLLGFLQQQYAGGANGQIFTAPNNAQFTDASAFFMIACDAINGGIQNLQFPIGIIKIISGGDLGVALSLQSINGNDNYFPVKNNIFPQITFQVFDAIGNICDFGGEQTSFQLRFRKVRNYDR